MKRELTGKHYHFSGSAIAKAVGDDETYRAIANTDDIDRDREIILPSGVTNLGKWLKKRGPIFYGHAWMSWDPPTEEQLPVGRAVEAELLEGRIEIGWKFSDLPFATQVRRLVDIQFLNATSIGFMGEKWITKPDEVRALLEDNDIAVGRDENGNEILPWAVATKWELLELSVVSIESNRGADILRSLDPEQAREAVGALKALQRPPLTLEEMSAKIDETVKETKGPEAKATPTRRRPTFAENYTRGNK